MPTARIEIEFVSKQWVIQVEASSILRADRKTVYADSFDGALEAASTAYREIEAKVAPTDEGAPRELTPELQEAVKRFNASAKAHEAIKAEEVEDAAFREGEQWPPEQVAKMDQSKDPIVLNKIEPQTEEPPKRGRHANACICEKCVAKRAPG